MSATDMEGYEKQSLHRLSRGNTFAAKLTKCARLAKDYHVLLICLTFINIWTRTVAQSQMYRQFPSLFNVAKHKSLFTEPSDSTCGVPVQNAYCRSSTFSNSIFDCRPDFCVQECPRRTSLPTSSNLLSASNYGSCVTTDTANVRPGSAANSFAAVFTSGASCYIHPLDPINLGSNGAFTLSFWIWQNVNDEGTVFEKYTSTGQTILRVRLSSTAVIVRYRSTFGEREVQFLDQLQPAMWNFIAIQVYDTSISYFVNGAGVGFAARGTRGLVTAVVDGTGVVRLGQSGTGTDQFTGRIQDASFFQETLTNREIMEVYGSALPEVFIQTTCRCPATHPRVKPQQTHFCIRNGVPDNTGDEVLRLNNDSHPIQYLNDGDSNSIWVSSFMDDVTVTVDLGDLFQVFYVVVQFYSPQPKVLTIERRMDLSSPWEPWQMYAEDCQLAFNMINNGVLNDPTAVNCLQFGTNGLIVPYSKGNVTFNVLSPAPQPRPGHNDFYNTPSLGGFVLASQVRIRMQGHYYVTHPRHEYYGLYEYIVTGRCQCHGHATSCDDSGLPYQCACLPESNTEGHRCERCKPLYNNKPYRDGTQVSAYNCKFCDCHDHADACVYDPSQDTFPGEHDRGGGGVCVSCQHNTAGRQCDTCAPFYYRPLEKSLYAVDVCTTCDCYSPGVLGDSLDCQKTGGQCACKAQVTGRQCDQCQPGYYNLQATNPMGCEACFCNSEGTINGDVSCLLTEGRCACKQNVRNDKCDACQYGFYGLNSANPLGCSPCNCHPVGSLDIYCNPDNGQCNCKPNVFGRQCNECQPGNFDFDGGCHTCDCDFAGTQLGTTCDTFTGQCQCKPAVTGPRCDQCIDGYYNLGADIVIGCVSCGCDPAGTNNQSSICDKVTGDCQCKPNVQGRACNQCKPNTYNLTAANTEGCQLCGCDPSGTLNGDLMFPHQLTCDQNNGQCACLANRNGLKCDNCEQDYYVNPSPGGGCNICNCNPSGTILLSHCDVDSGQCHCKIGTGVGGRRCDSCRDGYFGFSTFTGSCTGCNCDQAGSVNASSCDANTGSCQCKEFTTSRQCGVCASGTSNLQADNPFGCSKQPDQQPPPEYEPLNSTALRLYWGPPDYPNGVILRYYLYRNSVLQATLNSNDMEHIDTGLTPFTSYTYSVVAENDFGTTASPTVTFRTPSGPPTGSIGFSVQSVTATSAFFSWTAPPASNGIIQYYELNSTTLQNANPVTHYKGLGLSVGLFTLESYMYYEFSLSACTAGGCLDSPAQVVVTQESMPIGQQPPFATAIGSTELYLTWEPPEKPNGVIIYYELWMRGAQGPDGTNDPPAARIFHPAGRYDPLQLPNPQPLPPPATNYTARDLSPFKDYEFQVLSQNSMGLSASAWIIARTGESAPEFQPAPEVVPLSSTSVNVTWSAPSAAEAHGEIILYRVYHYKQIKPEDNPFAPPNVWMLVAQAEGTARSAVVNNMSPYSDQVFVVEACNMVGCVNSTEGIGRTLAGVPEGVPAPYIDGNNQSSMYVQWNPPAVLNGPEPYYIIRRVETALSKPPPEVARGTRFPGLGYYMFPPATIPQGVGFTGIELWFKTNQREGLILFASSEGGQEEFLALQLRAGRPWFLYDPQGCRSFVTVDLHDDFEAIVFDENGTLIENVVFFGTTYDDGQWHHLVARRKVNNATISIDGDYIGDKDTSCSTGNIIGRNTGVYLGGLPDDYNLQRTETDNRAQVNNINFQGCIRDVKILTQVAPEEVWTPLNWSTVVTRFSAAPDWEGCPEDLEPETAIHFLGTGYVVYDKGFPLERSNLRLTPQFGIDMRTERQNGILFFGFGVTGYFHLIQLVSGNIVWMYGTPFQRRTLVFPNSLINVCDGGWHTLHFEKDGENMRIDVDFGGIGVSEGTAPLAIDNLVEIASDMYVGGIPPSQDAQTAVRENNLEQLLQTNFGGCLRKFEVNRNSNHQTKYAIDVYMDGCPTPGENILACQEVSVEVVYNGTGNYTYDTGLDSFTEYIYQVEAVNMAGSVLGRWETGRTREGPPEGVTDPYDVQVINGFTINARWVKPTGHTGQIMSYILRAYHREDPDQAAVEMEFSGIQLSGQMTNAVPYTNYTLYLVACTAGGCTESPDGVSVFTFEEAPGVVLPPEALDQGGTYLHLEWQPPQMPNGVLTGYALFREGQQIYAGNQLNYNVTGLNMFNSYRFYVKACSRVGCTDSEVVNIATSQLPPTFMGPPRLIVLGTKVIRAEWDHPDQPNGRLDRYLLYASTNVLDEGEVVYNYTELFLWYEIPDLLAGTTYYIRVAACTEGGCTISAATSATTFESAPESILDPTIDALSSTILFVSWEIPEFPNGIITQYRLFQNGLLIYNHSITRQYTVSNLQPWSLHLFRVEACTIQGCGSSSEVSARTLEAPPLGNIGLNLRVEGQRSISVLWNGVLASNGIVYYDVYVEGLFYVNPDLMDYRTSSESRSLLQTQDSDQWMVIEALIPYSVYYVQVNASNTAGFLLSNSKQATMPQGSPDGVYSPLVTSPSPTTVQVEWRPVARTNADISPTFQLQFKEPTPGAPIIDLFSQPTTSNSYLKTGLSPFVEYEFRVMAINPYGRTTSEWVPITTRQDKPAGVDPPRVYNISARSVHLEWDPPLASNGIIIEYKIYRNSLYQQSAGGNDTNAQVKELLPYSVYTFQMEACTLAGCTRSAPSRSVTTLQDTPEGLPAPSLISQTATSVLVVWSEPEFTNGVILQYGIERRLLGQSDITLIRTFLANDPKQYLDQSSEVIPYTTYEYRLTAETSIGRAVGPWAEVTTKASRPGGVQAPTVRVLSPTSMEIEWNPPIQPNGRMESYLIALPEPRFEISNISNRYLLVENLTPFTDYSITVTACSEGGCTESQPTQVSTSPSVPQGLEAPVGTPISQTYISVLWKPPQKPNGPNLKYELSRMKISDPLNPFATDFGLWSSLYLGINTYFDDRGLTIYTTYQYRVTAYNDFGHAISEPSEGVTTFGGTPTKAAVVILTPINHTSFEVSWTTPSVQELQGGVARYYIDVTDGSSTQRYEADPQDPSVTASGLIPNTRYEVTVTIEVHGGGLITSPAGVITTLDGAPEGLDPPYKMVINESTVRISWTAPDSTNGVVLGYYLYVDGARIDTGQTTPGSYLLTNLEPYTIYRVQVEVCTVFACIRSPEITVTTAESIPTGVSPPALAVQGPYSILASWTEPLEANGVILRYELLRKIRLPCSQLDKPDPEPISDKCTYLECGILESFCGSQCYSGPKTCCSGVLYNNIQGYGCCDTQYIPQRADSMDVCCGGNFYTRLDNHVCCGRRYVELQPGEICCPDPDQDRVDIGLGDQCCGSIPYSSGGAQICCSGALYAEYDQQCCGGEVVQQDMVCCGNDTWGRYHLHNDGNSCCGKEYVPEDVSVCCADDTGNFKAHIYSSPEGKQSSNEKCCSTERISVILSCCNGNGYNPLVQACGDVSSMETGCGTGVVCPVTQTASAFCNRCNFDRSSHKCGSYMEQPRGQQQYLGETNGATGQQQGDMCMTEPVKIYTGMELLFQDENLSPFTEYHYALVVVNAAGSKSSEFIFATTSQALPEGLSAPEAEVLPQQLDTIYLTWQAPTQPNGEISAYILYRDGIEIFRDTAARQYRDDNAILPYQTYSYRLRICNGAGCAESDEVQIATLQAKPEQVNAPVVAPVSPSTLRITWVPPGRPNGYISSYTLYELTGGQTVAMVTRDVLEYTMTDLTAFTSYVFVLSACTDAGCTNSTESTGTTAQDKPSGLSTPRIVIVDVNTVELYWREPQEPNGIVNAYTLFRSTDGTLYTVSYTGLNLNHTDEAVQPLGTYWYRVQAETDGGATNSTVLTIQVPQMTPQMIAAPHNVTVLSSEEIMIKWAMPAIPNGLIDQYRVVLNAGMPDAITVGFGLQMEGAIDGLTPYTDYSVRIQVCNQAIINACGTGPAVVVTTFEAPPEGQMPPVVIPQGPKAIALTWEPPERPNGIITSYRVHRRLSGTSFEVLIAVVDGNVLEYVNSAVELQPYTEYEYKLTAVNSEGDTVSEWIRVRTLEAIPEGMSPIILEAVGAYSVSLSWSPPLITNGVILSYKIEYQPLLSDPTSRGSLQSVTVGSDVLATSVSGLKPYTRYEIRVTAANSVGSVSSSWSLATTAQAAPADIGPFTVEKISTGTSVILRWNEPGQPNGVINNYLIYESDNVIAIYQGLNREYEWRRLEPFTEYIIQLEACTAGGCGRSLMQKFGTGEVSPENQPAPTLGQVNSTSVTLKWIKPLNPNGKISLFEVLRQEMGPRQKRQIATPDVIYSTADTEQDEYEYTDTDIDANTVYIYQIRASNAVGSTVSEPLRVETPPGPPTGLTPPAVSQVPNKHDELLITWLSPGRPNGVLRDYQLQRNDTTPWSFDPDDPRQFTDTGLQAHTLYSYTITACTEGGCTTSAPTVRRTPQTAPLHVDPPNLSTVDASTIRVAWVEPQVLNGDIIEYRLTVDDEVVYRGLALAYEVNDLMPFQAYAFFVTACTSGGCTDSSSVIGRPSEDRPMGMQPPMLRVTSSTSIEITWQEPDQPNGIITSYELRRHGELVYTTTLLIYTDYEVEPGTTYSYTATAYNSRGSAMSAPSTATTYSSSPMGLAPPELEPLSSSSIRASWAPPLNPNGDILNYTLYMNGKKVYTDLQLTIVMRNLSYWTDHTFRVEACTQRGCTTSDPVTARTLEAGPEGLAEPRLTPLADSNGAHSGVLVEWASPRHPNGVIIRYEVYRRLYDGPETSGSGVLIHSGNTVEYTDRDPLLQPYTQYQYRVVAYNSEGQNASGWELTRTREAPPGGVPAPVVKSTSATTITLELFEPQSTNGYINGYKVYLNNVERLVVHRLSLLVIVGERNPLKPFTLYTVYIEACTAGGCTPSPSVEALTLSALPEDLAAPVILNKTATSVDVYWAEPASPNGDIIAYEMGVRMTCPLPYADSDDAVTLPCEATPWVVKYRGLATFTRALGLLSYTRYEFRVEVENSAGSVSAVTEAITRPAPPKYSGNSFRIRATGGSILVDWSESFFINGEVDQFILYKNSTIVYSGSATSYSVLRETLYTVYTFQIVLVTEEGQAQTPRLYFDPTRPGGGVVIPPATTEAPAAATALPVYQEIWFIVIMAIVALVLLFIGIALCLHYNRYKRPYIRERMPLQPRQQKSAVPLAYSIDPYDGALLADLPHQPTNHGAHSVQSHGSAPFVGYINPAYSHLSLPSRSGSLLDLNLDHLSHKSGKWDDEDSLWDGQNLAGQDSGLHSLAYGDDYDADSDRPISVLKEHTMFTDTHL